MKRILIIFLCFTLILSLLVVPALAADTGLVSDNLLDTFSDFIWWYDDYGFDFTTLTPTASIIYDGYDVVVDMTTEESFYCLGLTLTIDCEEDVSLYLYYRGIGSMSSTTSGELISSNGSIKTYYFDIYDSIISTLSFTFYRNDPDSNFDVSLLSLVASNFNGLNGSSYKSLDMVGFKVTGTTLNREDQQYYQSTYYDNEVEIPYTYNQNTFADQPLDDIVNVFISAAGTEMVGADRVVFTFISTGVWDNYYDHDSLSQGGIFLQAKEAEFDIASVNIPINAYYSEMDSSWYGLPVYRITVVADVSGYDMSYYDLYFSTTINGRYPNHNNDTFVDYYFRLDSFGFYYDSDMLEPWYRRLANWINDGLNTLGNRINTGFNFINTRLITEFSGFWVKLDAKLNSIFGSNVAPPVMDDQQDQMQGAIDDFNDAADDIENSRNELEDLMPDMPRWEDTGLGELAGQFGANIHNILGVFSVIYENVIVTQILTYTFLFALGGFILFGER